MSMLKEAFEAGKFGVTAEMAPPKGYDFSEQLEAAKLLNGKVHGVNVTDMQSASLKASSLGLCVALKNAGVEPILQMTGRDRNRMAIMGDILSAAAFGTANFVSAAAGLARVTLLNEPWAEIAREPKVVLAAPETSITDYMAGRGFAENEQERMGALRVFEKDGAKEYVLCSVNRWFARWVW